MKKVLTILLLFMAIIITAYGQDKEIKGTVVDTDGNPIKGVKISPIGLDISTTTDESGKYHLKQVPDSIKALEFYHPEKEVTITKIKMNQEINVTMNNLSSEWLSLEELLNMEVIVASKSADKLSDAPGIVSVMTSDEISRFGGVTLAEILNRISGLSISTSYFSDRTMIAARGDQIKPNSGHILYLINGRPVREILEGGLITELLETFPVSVIERIEVIKGPGSVLYGTNAFSGVVNIITKESESSDISISPHGGWDGNYGMDGNAHLNFGDVKISVAGKYYKKDDWNILYTPSAGTNTNPVNISIPYEGISSFFDISYKNFHYTSSINQLETQYFLRGNLGTNKWQRYFNNLGYGKDITSKWHTDINFTYTPTSLKSSNFPFVERNSNELFGEWTNIFTINDNLKLITGGLYSVMTGKEEAYNSSPATINSDETRNSFGFYSQIDYQLHKTVKLIGGIQLNKVEEIDLNAVPRIGVIYNPTPSLNVKALYSEAFRAPSINEIDLNYPTLKGNPNLVPEDVKNIDISIGYHGESFYTTINYFKSKQTNIIIVDRSITPAMYKNLGEFNIEGFELEGKYYINRQLLAMGSLLHQNNENQDGVKNVSPIPNLFTKFGLSYQTEKGHTISIFDIYQGDLGELFNTKVNPNPDAYNLINVYAKYNLASIINPNSNNKMYLFVQADNVLDKEVWLPEWGGISSETIPYYSGRIINIGLNLVF